MTICQCELANGGSVVIPATGSATFLLYLGLEGITRVIHDTGVDLVAARFLDIRVGTADVTLSTKLGASGLVVLVPEESIPFVSQKRGARNLSGRLPVSVFDTRQRDCSPSARVLADCLAAVTGCLEDEHCCIRRFSELIRLLLAETLLENQKPLESKRGPTEPWFLRVIERHIIDHVVQSTSIEELARVAGVSQRTLHDGFRKHRGYSPMRFLRDQRMERVKDELSAPGPTTSVTESALKWGFTHLGRFSSYYVSQFGERPSETLRRARTSGISGQPSSSYSAAS